MAPALDAAVKIAGLQWDRTREGAEIVLKFRVAHMTVVASMGPHP